MAWRRGGRCSKGNFRSSGHSPRMWACVIFVFPLKFFSLLLLFFLFKFSLFFFCVGFIVATLLRARRLYLLPATSYKRHRVDGKGRKKKVATGFALKSSTRTMGIVSVSSWEKKLIVVGMLTRESRPTLGLEGAVRNLSGGAAAVFVLWRRTKSIYEQRSLIFLHVILLLFSIGYFPFLLLLVDLCVCSFVVVIFGPFFFGGCIAADT